MESIKELIQVVLENSEDLEEGIAFLNEVLETFIRHEKDVPTMFAEALKKECEYLKRCPCCGADESCFRTFIDEAVDLESNEPFIMDSVTFCSKCGLELE